jgi:hypothetical protein
MVVNVSLLFATCSLAISAELAQTAVLSTHPFASVKFLDFIDSAALLTVSDMNLHGGKPDQQAVGKSHIRKLSNRLL